MNHLRHKLNLYMKITGMKRPSLGIALRCNTGEINRLFPKTLKRKLKPILNWKYENLLSGMRQHFVALTERCKPSQPFTSFWPELFVPELPDVEQLIPYEQTWYAVTDKTSSLLHLDIPYWPLSPETGILVQTETGWVKKSELPIDPYIEMVAGKAHIPGNFDPHIIEYVKNF